jgi:O-antigen/teichoic acid export membrane protein
MFGTTFVAESPSVQCEATPFADYANYGSEHVATTALTQYQANLLMTFPQSYNRIRSAMENLLLSEGLRAKAIFGGAWLAGGSIAEQAVRFARNIVLARLLAPGDFGTMAIVLSASSLVETLTEVGVRGAIIQNSRGGEDSYLNASWWLGMIRAIGTYIFVFALAPWIASFYGRTELTALLRVALLSTIFNGAMSPRSILPQKEMKFARWTAISNGGGICGVLLTVMLSFILQDVWALAIGYSAENALRCFLSYLLCPGFPSLKWDWRAAREILTFSRGIFGLSFLNIIIGRADVFVLARLYSSTDLGLYTMGVAIVITPLAFITSLLGQVIFPALSRIQEDTERLNRISTEITSVLILVGLPAAVSVGLCAPSLLKIVYGTRYAAAAGPLTVAAAVVFFTVVNAPLTLILLATGRPALHRVAVVVSACAMLFTVYPACRVLGTLGGQVAALIAVVAGYIYQVIRLRGLTSLNLVQYGKAFVSPALASAGTLGIVVVSRQCGLATTPTSDVVICISACLIVYAVSATTIIRTVGLKNTLRSAQTPDSVVSP